jgi:hypothetical protein
MRYYDMDNSDYDDAVVEAKIEREREKKLNLYIHNGPEWHEDWMDWCETCRQEACECEAEENEEE